MYEPVCRVLYFIQSIPVGEQVAGITVTMATIWAPHLYPSRDRVPRLRPHDTNIYLIVNFPASKHIMSQKSSNLIMQQTTYTNKNHKATNVLTDKPHNATNVI